MVIPECQKQDKNIFKRIIEENWEAFKHANPTYAQPQYEETVWKALHCGTEQGGYTDFRCINCCVGTRRIAFTCKSCFCLSCAKVYTDEIVSIEYNTGDCNDINNKKHFISWWKGCVAS